MGSPLAFVTTPEPDLPMLDRHPSASMAASVAGMQAPGPVVSVILGAGLLDETIKVDTVAEVFLVVVSLTAVVAAIIELAQAESRLAMWRRAARQE